MANTKKIGRKQKHWTNSLTGKPVEGLTKRPDGRWRVIGTHQTFREPDEQKAIAKFHKLTAGQSIDVQNLLHQEWLTEQSSQSNASIWEWVAEEIRTRPLWVAEQTGIEQIGYLKDLKAPESLPTIEVIEKEWETHYAKSNEQKRRVMDAWRDFKTTTGITNLEGITPRLCREFCDNVIGRKLAPKSQSNMFTRIRRLFTWLKSRDVAPEAMGKIVDAMKRLVASDMTVSLDPHPIDPDDFHKLVNAGDPDNKAMTLLMLNGAFTLTEVIRLKWDEIKKETIVTRRKKSGRCIRVCVLWKETIDALALVKQRSEYIFLSREGVKFSTSGADKRFRALRKKAKVSDTVTASHLRDGAATALAEAGVEGVIFSIAMGHSSGIKDHYIARNPKMVLPAMTAIYKAYFPPKDDEKK